ncbi:hypothetical protein Tco_1092949 [Tanacetum coccineum]|uniref:Uncharacterized protein n=1 Tax=Tanacetum coccineum TaxID=301880 RepID=A0ABQ5IBC6_9ASTR
MASYRLNPLYAIKECSSCGSLYTRECCSIGSLENKILVPEPDSSLCCAKCGTPVDGPYCRGCALLWKKFEEDLLTYYFEIPYPNPIVSARIFSDGFDVNVPTCDNNRVNVEFDLVESLINSDTLIVYYSKIDPVLEKFAGELAHIKYVDATPSYSELVNDVDQEEKEFDLEDIFQIQDVILREKLLNVHRLISNIESLKVNPIPDGVLESLFPIPVADSDSFLEESDTSLSHLDNSLPEFETFSDHTEETGSGPIHYSC